MSLRSSGLRSLRLLISMAVWPALRAAGMSGSTLLFFAKKRRNVAMAFDHGDDFQRYPRHSRKKIT